MPSRVICLDIILSLIFLDLVAIDFGTLWRLNTLAFEIRGIVRFSFIFFRLIDVSISLERYRIPDSEIKIFELFIFPHFLDSI